MEKKPEWLKVRYNQDAVNEVAALMRNLKLNTVCKEANCPNLGECYQKHTSTFSQAHRMPVSISGPSLGILIFFSIVFFLSCCIA